MKKVHYSCSIEIITLVASMFFTLFCNNAFWMTLLNSKNHPSLSLYLILCSVAITLICFHWLLLLLVSNRWTIKWVLSILFLITSIVVYFISTFNVYFDSSMIINILSTDVQESSELLQWRMLLYLLPIGIVPCTILILIKIKPSPIRKRVMALLLSTSLSACGFWSIIYEFGPIIREKKGLMYQLVPLNIIYSSIRTYTSKTNRIVKKRQIGIEAHLKKRPPKSKPRVIILVVGETVRAANWGLNGYQRQTTPKLARHIPKLINFSQVTSCGTSTAVSIPCMFSPYGAHAYNKKKIDETESLLHLLHKLNISILWRDNQSGCKGVCDGLPNEKLHANNLCTKDSCFDEILLGHLKEKIEQEKKDQVIVLHMLGNHGPAYYQRYPSNFRRWLPICETTDLASCSHETIVNTYDNAIRYTDHILASAINMLAKIKTHDTGFIYLSDHGESLGEYNLFLHGVPSFIAPDEQNKVPLILWLSSGLKKRLHLNINCLQQKKDEPISHDYLFSTMLSLFDVDAREYNPQFDLLRSCRKQG